MGGRTRREEGTAIYNRSLCVLAARDCLAALNGFLTADHPVTELKSSEASRASLPAGIRDARDMAYPCIFNVL